MKKVLLVALLVLLFAVGLGQWLLNDPGYVLIVRGHWRLEASLGLWLLLLLAGWVATIFVVLLLVWLWRRLAPRHLSRRVGSYLTRRRLERGLKALGHGEWKRAAKLFAAAGDGDWAAPGLLGAAFAYQQLGQVSERDASLEAVAGDRYGENFALWLGLLWRSREGQPVTALLEEQVAHAPNNLPLRRLAAELAEREERWRALRKHLQHLPKHEQQQEARQQRLWHGLLQQTATEEPDADKRAQALRECWREVPTTLKKHAELALQYGGYLAQSGDAAGALKVLGDAIERGWDTRFVPLLEDLPCPDPIAFLALLEKWQQHCPAASELQLLAGRAALKAQLWGKAEQHLRQAGSAGCVVAWAELARLKQAQGDLAAVQECLVEQSRQVSGALPTLPLPKLGG